MAGRIDYFDDPAAPPANSIVPSVTAIVRNLTGSLLLVHRTDNGLWALPGGGVDPGESVQNAVVREVQEETGIQVAVTALVGIYSDPRHVMVYADGEVRQQFSLCFATTFLGGILATSQETNEVRFVAVSKISEMSIHPSMRLRISHGLDGHRVHPYIG